MHISVIIATSLKRTSWLLERSLLSVYKQEKVDNHNIKVIIIDDNHDENEFNSINNQVSLLREKLGIHQSVFSTTIFRNKRTRFMSGSGAWNTGIYYSSEVNPEGFVSILDDDDEYLPNHLADCIDAVDNDTIAVFQRLIWKGEDNSITNFPLIIDQLKPETFFIGNPGIQGSNMFFKTKNIVETGGFDEKLPNTTDRDLMIRFLCHFQKPNKKKGLNIKVLNNLGVIHYDHLEEKVNNNIALKKEGLRLFYQKHKSNFSEKAYQQSIERAKILFNYIPYIDK